MIFRHVARKRAPLTEPARRNPLLTLKILRDIHTTAGRAPPACHTFRNSITFLGAFLAAARGSGTGERRPTLICRPAWQCAQHADASPLHAAANTYLTTEACCRGHQVPLPCRGERALFLDRYVDEFHDGRPSAAVNNIKIDAVHRWIETYRHVTYEIRASLGMDMSQIQSILHKHLGMKKLCSRLQEEALLSLLCRRALDKLSDKRESNVFTLKT
ncbi:hypothetical protein EVAR_38754_1 [Eumeta japonica]|uniref:Uncharacterized protein n=1 Tax=Eumeta variegata TaxID=151549 RepID=A0A4C1WKI3_EUMVA|nr:hypothetical protein EVAR_38754_1 [Eumeta japonica]